MSIRELFDQVSISLINFLHHHEAVSNVKYAVEEPITSNAKFLVSWPSVDPVTNEKPPVTLPDDYKAFLSCTNGLNLTYDIQLLPFGYLHINALDSMIAVNDVSMTELRKTDVSVRYAFEIDFQQSNGRVALVYKQQEMEESASKEYTTEIWFQDLGLQWHFITHSFTQYFRLCLLHLGIPHWQYAFTTIGLPPQSKMWFAFLSPERLEIDKHGKASGKVTDKKKSKTKKIEGFKVNFNKVNQVLKKHNRPDSSRGNRPGTGSGSSSSLKGYSVTSSKRPPAKN